MSRQRRTIRGARQSLYRFSPVMSFCSCRDYSMLCPYIMHLGWLDSTCRDLPVCTPSLIFTLRPAIIQRIDVDGFIERVV
jgi:hypothetical protein